MKWILVNLKKWPSIFLIKKGALGFVGFILSPLSWWNDIIINVPLAYGFAWLIGKSLHIFINVQRWLFVGLFILGYFITNLAGFLIIHYSISGGNKAEKNSWTKQVVISLFYTLLIILLAYLDILKLPMNLSIIPGWVIK